MGQITVTLLPLEEGYMACECSECGPLGLYPAHVAHGAMFNHIAVDHIIGARL